MNRRTVLKAAGVAGVGGSATLSGCLGSDSNTSTSYRWSYDVGGRLDAVQQGTVFGREGSDGDASGADGQIFALDAATGEPQWTYGETGELSSYTELTAVDGVYFSYCGDDDCQGLYALELDGQERWAREINPGHGRPRVVDDVVFVGNDFGTVRAFDAETGETQWTRDVLDPDERGTFLPMVDVTDAVYVETGAALVALDREDGSTRWRYDPDDVEEQPNLESTVSNGIAYVVTRNRVAGVDDGDELWHSDFEESESRSETEIVGTASNRLFVFTDRLYAFDVTTGERDWVSERIDHPNEEHDPRVALHDDVVYVGADRLRALDATTGEERWSKTHNAGPVQSVTVVEEGVTEDHAVFVHADENQLASFDPTGEQTWDGSVDGAIWNYLVDEYVFVATDTGIFALNHQRGS